nr:PREDICTED: UDP-glucuronosyltransferase 2A1-like isoform X2 [Bemisia tabaci]
MSMMCQKFVIMRGLTGHVNYTHVDLSFSYQYIPDENNAEDAGVNLQRIWSKWELPLLWKALARIARKQLQSETFLQFDRRVAAERINFDLFIVEFYYLPFSCAILRNYTKSAPIITLSSMPTDFLTEETLGSYEHLSYSPSLFSDYTDRMSLLQKLDNWISHYYIVSKLNEELDISVRRHCKEAYGPEYEMIADGCKSRISLSLIASNAMYGFPRLLGPNVIETGPLHIRIPKELPQDLQNWLDGAEKGVIYFSLGCNLRGKSLNEDVRANFLKVFAQLQPLGYRVLWKWELDEKIPGQSSNILAQKWIPQQSVLAHPKIKVFITQGGLQSFQEAVHHGVPMVGIPWFVDQGFNVAKMVDAGIGVKLLPKNLHSYEDIKLALETVLHDKKYSDNMKRHSAISHDLTSRAMDRAVFWVEHVARHKGASHLRPSAADASLFEFFCFDIISVILCFGLTIVYFLFKLLVGIVFKKIGTKIKLS